MRYLPFLTFGLTTLLFCGCRSTQQPLGLLVTPKTAEITLNGQPQADKATSLRLNRGAKQFITITAEGYVSTQLTLTHTNGAWKPLYQTSWWKNGLKDAHVTSLVENGVLTINLPPDNLAELEKAAQHDAQAQVELGRRFWKGVGAPQNLEQARLCFSKAALQNDPTGKVLYGFMLAEGLGGPQDKQEAKVWLQGVWPPPTTNNPAAAPTPEPNVSTTQKAPPNPVTDEELTNLQLQAQDLLKTQAQNTSATKRKKL